MIWMEKRKEIWKKIQSNSAAYFKGNLHYYLVQKVVDWIKNHENLCKTGKVLTM